MTQEKNTNGNSNSGKQFFSGVLVLTLSTILVKIIGVLYKIPMWQYLGSSGMGYFNSAYDIYTLFFIISTAGLPVAISIMISENKVSGKHKNVAKIFKVSLLLLAFVGFFGALLMGISYSRLSVLINNSEARFCILAISPTVFFICVSSAIRGYFQGNQKMLPTAISQVIESLGKLFLGLFFAFVALKKGYSIPKVSAFAVLGITIGVVISMIYLVICKIVYRPQSGENELSSSTDKTGDIIKKLLVIAIPITISSTIMSFTKIIDMTMIMQRLTSIGYSEDAANEIYGSYSTMAVPIFNLPTTFVSAIALPLVPMLTAAIESRDRDRERGVVFSAVKLTSLIGFPSMLGIAVFSKPILALLFSGGDREIEYTAPLLSILALSIFLSCMITVTNAILQAYKKTNKPLISMIVGSVVKVIASYILIGIPSINIYGAPISTFLSILTIVAMNMYYISRESEYMQSIMKLFGKPFIATFAAISAGVAIYIALEAFISFKGNILIVIGAVLILYLLFILKMKALEKDDILMLPAGEKILKLLKKIKLIKE